jgi:hypothetical protein
MGAAVRGQSPLLGEGIRGSVRLGRLGIGMISKSAKKDGTLKVHQCQKMKPIHFLYLVKMQYEKK